MDKNSDLSLPALINSCDLEWEASPAQGVWRRRLDRLGGEVARATTIVRFEKGRRFPFHTHDGGEEFLVLQGEFEDEHGVYPVGSYVRNPPGTGHAPGTQTGCILFVKLWQFSSGDGTQLSISTNDQPFSPSATHSGIEELPLFEFGSETVALETWPPGKQSERDLEMGGGIPGA